MFTEVASPCVNTCKLIDNKERGKYCEGCLRTPNEIGAWKYLSDAERLEILRVIELRKNND